MKGCCDALIALQSRTNRQPASPAPWLNVARTRGSEWYPSSNGEQRNPLFASSPLQSELAKGNLIINIPQ